MSIILVTGSSGLVGSEAVRHFTALGHEVVGVDNDLRQYFFGPEGSTAWNLERLREACPTYRHHGVDIRDTPAVNRLFEHYGSAIAGVIHAAGQPSHDWAAREPLTDFAVNAQGTLTLLEASRQFCPEAVFIYMSTNKVYGDTPNRLPLVEADTRWCVDPSHRFAEPGIDESMSVDQNLHSLFGVSKLAGDLLVQEYGRYFGMRTACFRAGCITGADHAGTQLHGFLNFLMKCTIAGRPYTVFGYQGKQVRDNITSHDLVRAFAAFFRAPRVGQVYNIGGGPQANCSVIEAIAACEQRAGKKLDWRYTDDSRVGDHIWWISDPGRFRNHYPGWSLSVDMDALYDRVYEGLVARLAAA